MMVKFFSRKNRMMTIGLLMVTSLLLVALFCRSLEPNDPHKVVLADKNQLPSEQYPLGTDSMGRCMLSRILEGTRASLGIALLAIAISVTAGSVIGVISGYAGGVIDAFLMRLTDVFMSFPGIIFALTILAISGPGFWNAAFALSAIEWTGYARLTRGETSKLRSSEFIEGAKAIGNNEVQVAAKYLLPKIAPQVLVLIPLDISKTIMASASLSFLGLGIQPPIAEWGSMLNEARQFIQTAPHMILYTSIALVLSALAFNILGEGIRDRLNPYLAE